MHKISNWFMWLLCSEYKRFMKNMVQWMKCHSHYIIYPSTWRGGHMGWKTDQKVAHLEISDSQSTFFSPLPNPILRILVLFYHLLQMQLVYLFTFTWDGIEANKRRQVWNFSNDSLPFFVLNDTHSNHSGSSGVIYITFPSCGYKYNQTQQTKNGL